MNRLVQTARWNLTAWPHNPRVCPIFTYELVLPPPISDDHEELLYVFMPELRIPEAPEPVSWCADADPERLAVAARAEGRGYVECMGANSPTPHGTCGRHDWGTGYSFWYGYGWQWPCRSWLWNPNEGPRPDHWPVPPEVQEGRMRVNFWIDVEGDGRFRRGVARVAYAIVQGYLRVFIAYTAASDEENLWKYEEGGRLASWWDEGRQQTPARAARLARRYLRKNWRGKPGTFRTGDGRR